MKQKIFKADPKEAYEYNINRVFLGIFAIIFGLVFLINNFNIYSLAVDFSNLWPLFIIFVGLSLFKKKNIVSTMVGSIITILCVVLFCYSLASYTLDRTEYFYQSNSTPIVVVKDTNMEKAEIELNAGAGEFNIYGTDSDNLIDGRLMTSVMESEINQTIADSIQKVNISIHGARGMMKSGQQFKNEFNIGISKDVPVDLVFNSGGSNNRVDLSEIQAEKVSISTGASNLYLKVGDNVDSNIAIEAGASSITLGLPETAGVRLTVKSGFSSQELSGLSLVGDNIYQSAGYESKEKKINIEITMGMASLKVDWYSPIKKSEVSLFYYNQAEDKENTCDSDYILPVERYVVESDNQIKDAIELLIEGKLTEKEKSEGFSTEFPNKDFKLLSSSLDENGVLTLEFSEVPGFTTGGSCRVGILASEIIKTAKQFPGIKEVVFEPESLFEP